MGLRQGNSRKVISQNIAKLEREGVPHNQAVGIVLRKAKRTQPQESPQGCVPVTKPSV